MAKDKITQMFEDQENRIKRMRAIINAMHAGKIVIEDGKIVSVKFSASEIKDLVDAEDCIMKMERRLVGLPEKM